MFDLHTHTNASDGELTPRQLVLLAIKRGIRYLAITDHDTTNGIDEAQRAAEHFAIEVIPGVELSSEVAQDEIHILGYFIEDRDGLLEKSLEKLRIAREKRVDGILGKLSAAGIRIDRESVEKYRAGPSIGRPHVARALIEAGIAVDVREAFEKYLGRSSDFYVPRPKISPEEAIKLIIGAGGIPVLAHPGMIQQFSAWFPRLLEAGLMGIEAYYPLHTPLQTGFFLDAAKENGLTVTAGSDYHGINAGRASVPGCPGIPSSVINDFIKFCGEKRGVMR